MNSYDRCNTGAEFPRYRVTWLGIIDANAAASADPVRRALLSPHDGKLCHVPALVGDVVVESRALVSVQTDPDPFEDFGECDFTSKDAAYTVARSIITAARSAAVSTGWEYLCFEIQTTAHGDADGQGACVQRAASQLVLRGGLDALAVIVCDEWVC
jgi:hypothetical protein